MGVGGWAKITLRERGCLPLELSASIPQTLAAALPAG